MNESTINALSRSLGVDKTYSTANQRHVKRGADDRDTVQLSKLPDLSTVEARLEKLFEEKASALAGDVEQESYPPLETIDRLAAMFAINLGPENETSE